MYFLDWVCNIWFDFKSTPLHSNGDDGSDLFGRECCDDYVRTIVGIFGFDLDIESRFRIDIDFSYEFSTALLVSFLGEETS